MGASTPLRLAATAAILSAAVGCGTGHFRAGNPTGSATISPSTAPATSPGQSARPATTAPAPAPTSRPSTARCATTTVTGRFRPAGPAAGHRYAFLVLTNGSGSACRVFGYPGLLLRGASGALPTNLVRVAPDGGPASVRLAPGQSAQALLRWSVVPAADEPQHGPCEPAPSQAWLTPPDEFTHLTLAWTMGMVCGHGTIWVAPFTPSPASPS